MQNILSNLLRAHRLFRSTRFPPPPFPPFIQEGPLLCAMLVGWPAIAYLYRIDYKGIRTMHEASAASLEKTQRGIESIQASHRAWRTKMNAEQRASVLKDDNVPSKDVPQFAMQGRETRGYLLNKLNTYFEKFKR